MRQLYGRDEELAMLRSALDTSTGLTGTVVVTGEPGIGKTTLLNALVRDQLSHTLVLRAVGVESEAEIAYAALHLMLGPLIGRIDALPSPQQAAVRTAMGLADGPTPNRFHVGLAVLTLLTDAATEQPVLCVVDDAHLIDQESLDAMTFACRRIFIDRVSIVFASRLAELPTALVGFDRRHLNGLDTESARQLLANLHPTGLDSAAAQRLVDQAAGNPLVLRELGQAMSVDELNRRLTEPRPLPAVEAAMVSFEQDLSRLAEPVRDLLLVLAADERGDSHVLKRAAAELGTELDVLYGADVARLLNFDGDQFAFRHPLIRSACYEAASSPSRRRAHGILARIIDESVDVERHAWHRSLASSPPDDRIADVLRAAARRAGRRGATRSQVELLARSAEFREDAFTRALGLIVAGGVATMIGDTTRMTDLATRARAASSDPFLAAEVSHLEALAPVFQRQFGAASSRLLDAARELDRIDRNRAREVLLESLFTMMGSTTLTEGLTEDQLARAIIDMPSTGPGPPSTTDLLLDGFATVIVDGWQRGAPMLREAVRRWPDEVLTAIAIQRQYGPAIWAAMSLWDEDGLQHLLESSITITRAAGALSPLRSLLVEQAKIEASFGWLNRADATASEINDLSNILDVEADWWSVIAATTLALRGEESEALAAIAVLRQMGEHDQHGHALEQSLLAEAVLANGNRRYGDAANAASQVAFESLSLCAASALVELAEALARVGDAEALAGVVAATEQRASVSGTDLAQGVMLRARALASDRRDADELFQESLDYLSRTQAAPLTARTHLVYGEWLRRENRRLDRTPTSPGRVRAIVHHGAGRVRRACEDRAPGDR